MKPRDYDSTVARIAGNIASGFVRDLDFDAMRKHPPDHNDLKTVTSALVLHAVALARAIVDETRRTEHDPRIELQAKATEVYPLQPAEKAEAGAL